MQVVEHQLTAAGDGDTADRVAAVQVQKLHKAGLHRQLHAVGCGDIRRREGQQAGPGGSVGSGQGIQKIGRVVILAENAVLVEEGGIQRLALVHMVGTGGADIHLLQQAEVGVLLLQVPGDGVHVGRQALF